MRELENKSCKGIDDAIGNLDEEIMKEFEKEEIRVKHEKETGNMRDWSSTDPYKGKKEFYLVSIEDWDEYAEKKSQEFEDIAAMDLMDSTIMISNIPNYEEFCDLITFLKDSHGGKMTEFIITSCGFGRFYDMYTSTGLKDVTKAINHINRNFYSEFIGEFKISIMESILEKNKSGKRFVLHMSRQQKAAIQKLLHDIKVLESSFGLLICIETLNKAKGKFGEFLTDKYQVLYEDDGYTRLIKMEIDRATIDGVDWLVNIMPVMLRDIEVNKQQYLYDVSNQKLEKTLIYKIDTIEDVMRTVENENREIPTKYELDFILHKDEIKLRQQIPISS